MAKAAPAPKNRRIFNLLKPYIPPLSGWDRIYEWLLGKARVVMIVVEIVVAVTFIFKVVVDTQAKGLDDEIKAKDTELKQYAISVEPILKKLQKKSEVYTSLWDRSSRYSGILAEVHSYIPNPGTDLLITISKDELTISGEDDFAVLAGIEKKLKASSSFTEIAVTQLNADTATSEQAKGNYILSARIGKVSGRERIRKV